MTKSEHFSESWEGWHLKKINVTKTSSELSWMSVRFKMHCSLRARVFWMKQLLKKNNYGDSQESLLGKKIRVELRLL